MLQAIFTPERLTSYCLRFEVLLGQLLPPLHTSTNSAGGATATGRHLFAEGAYDMVMQMVKGSSTAMEDCSSSTSLSWGSGGSVQLLYLAAVWHAIMRARARSYESYADRSVSNICNTVWSLTFST